MKPKTEIIEWDKKDGHSIQITVGENKVTVSARRCALILSALPAVKKFVKDQFKA